MTKEDLQNRIEQVAYDGATDGCNQAVIEREASKLAREVVKLFAIQNVSGMLPLTENAKSKLEYINGSCIARDFPKEQPTKQWAGAVLDLLEELGLGNYR